MSRTDPQFNLRIPESLRDKVMSASRENKRSATAEILARLESSFSPDLAAFLGPEMRKRVEENAQFRGVSTGAAIALLLERAFWYTEDLDQPVDSDEESHEPLQVNDADNIFAQAIREVGLGDMYSKVERTDARLATIETQLQQLISLLSVK